MTTHDDSRVILESYTGGTWMLRSLDGKRSALFQTDYDYVPLASGLGFDLTDTQGVDCEHESTDGTVACKACGLDAGDFIGAAVEWLEEHEGEEFDNPGYELESDDAEGE